MDSSRRVSSRLIKHEKQKLTKQIFWFSALAVALVVLFIFVVLPLFIRFVNSVLDTNPIAEEDTIILQPPVLSAPVSATNSAQFKINGFADPDEEVVVVLNGREHTRTNTEEDGSFSAEILLTEGENSFTMYAIDAEDRESRAGQEYRVSLDTEEPLLELAEPEDGREYGSKDTTAVIAGKTDPGSKIYVNDRLNFPDAEGNFRIQYTLKSGDNELIIKAVDNAGNYTEVERTIKRKE